MYKKIIYTPPSDKSITIRTLILSSLYDGKVIIENPLISNDTKATIYTLKKLGCKIISNKNSIHINGVGLYGFKKNLSLNVGESALLLRLILPIISLQNSFYTIYGEKTILKRNFSDTIIPLTKIGIKIEHNNYHLPFKIYPSEILGGKFKVTSAQVKSSLLILSLYDKDVWVLDYKKTRDHTENLIKHWGGYIIEKDGFIRAIGQLKPKRIKIYGDISSASVIIATALILNYEILVKDCFINSRRAGFLNMLKKMGIPIKLKKKRHAINEKVADIEIKPNYKNLKPVYIADITDMIDEVIIASILLSYIKGKSIIKGVSKISNKESNRKNKIIEILKKLGSLSYYDDDKIEINGGNVKKINYINSSSDHRVAMAGGFLKVVNNPSLKISDPYCVSKTYPNFWKDMNIFFSVKI
ncbi:MAG: hypothetical protein N2Z20_00785 [Elusimicrobiales bacterium]|nr:hypothetical protein [Elusimicrobiales bacterium]